MPHRVLIATTGKGLARASQSDGRSWNVATVLAGMDVRCLAADPLHPERVFAGTNGLGVLRSEDRGHTWRPAGLAGRSVTCLGVSRAEPDVVYAGTRPAQLYVSQDGGAHWIELRSFRRAIRGWWFSPAEWPYRSYVQGIALSPDDAQVIVAGVEFGTVVRSADGGRTWSGHRRGALRDCHSLVWHATDRRWVYEGGGTGGGGAVSRDGGITWSCPRRGLDRHYGWAVAADPGRPEVWYLSAAPGPGAAHGAGSARAHIFRSTDDSGWHKLSGGLPAPLPAMPYALLTDPAAGGYLYAGLSNGDVWQTMDYGDRWERLPCSLGGIHRAMILIR